MITPFGGPGGQGIPMDDQILQEIRELKIVLANLLGIAEPSIENPFSIEAIEKAGAAFHKMNIERGE